MCSWGKGRILLLERKIRAKIPKCVCITCTIVRMLVCLHWTNRSYTRKSVRSYVRRTNTHFMCCISSLLERQQQIINAQTFHSWGWKSLCWIRCWAHSSAARCMHMQEVPAPCMHLCVTYAMHTTLPRDAAWDMGVNAAVRNPMMCTTWNPFFVCALNFE